MSNMKLVFGIALFVIGLVPPEKEPNGIAPLDENTGTSDFSMALFFVVGLLGISIVYIILKNRIIPNMRIMNTRVFDDRALLPSNLSAVMRTIG